jgi:flagellar hook-length control protein FliK
MTELRETDRAVLDMRENTQRTRVEPVKAEETASANVQTATSQQTQTTQQASPIREAQPLRPAPEFPDPSEQIRMQVAKNLESGRTEFRMQLAPEELGKISVKLVMEAGKLTVEIIASGERTAQLLSRQAEALGTALRSHTGMNLTSVNVVTEGENASGNMGSPYDANGGQPHGSNQQPGNGRGAQHRQQPENPDFAGPDENAEAELDARLDTTI